MRCSVYMYAYACKQGNTTAYTYKNKLMVRKICCRIYNKKSPFGTSFNHLSVLYPLLPPTLQPTSNPVALPPTRHRRRRCRRRRCRERSVCQLMSRVQGISVLFCNPGLKSVHTITHASLTQSRCALAHSQEPRQPVAPAEGATARQSATASPYRVRSPSLHCGKGRQGRVGT